MGRHGFQCFLDGMIHFTAKPSKIAKSNTGAREQGRRGAKGPPPLSSTCIAGSFDQRWKAVRCYGTAWRKNEPGGPGLGEGGLDLIADEPGGNVGKVDVIQAGHQGERRPAAGFGDARAAVQISPGEGVGRVI